MFSWYKSLIERIFESIFEKSGEVVSFLDYLAVVGLSLLIMLMVAAVIAILYGSAVGPVFTYRKLLSGVKKLMDNFNAESSAEEYELIKKKIRNRRTLFWSLFVFVYLPIVIPTILYVVSLIVGLF